MSYVVFCLRFGNAVTEFASELDACGALRDWVHDRGLESIQDLAHSHIENGEISLIALDDDLVRRVIEQLSPEAVASESRR